MTARVLINGFELPTAWQAGTGLVATESITIPWGRSSITDEVQGHAATIVVLDTSADGAAAAQLVGQRLAVDRVPAAGAPVRLLNGVIADQTSAALRLRHPVTGVLHEVLRVELTVSNDVAVLAKRREGGYYSGLQLYGQGGTPTRKVAGPWGRGGWDSQFAADRLADIVSLAGFWVPSAVTPRDTFTSPAHPLAMAATRPIRPVQEGVPSSDLVPLWPLVQGVYAAAEGLGWPRLIPGLRVEQGRPQTAAPIRLVTGTTATSPLRVETTDTAVPARLLGIPDKRTYPSASAQQRTTGVAVAIARHEYAWQERLVESGTGRVLREDQLLDTDTSETVIIPVEARTDDGTTVQLPSRSASTVIIPTSSNAAIKREEAASAWNAAIAVAIEAAQRAAQLNGWRTLPPLTYRPRAGEPERAELLQTWDTTAAYLAGSKWAGLPGVPITVQFIGGTLTWDRDGWTHELIPAPTIDTRRHNLSVGELLGELPNRIDHADPSLTWADLAAATERSTT